MQSVRISSTSRASRGRELGAMLTLEAEKLMNLSARGPANKRLEIIDQPVGPRAAWAPWTCANMRLPTGRSRRTSRSALGFSWLASAGLVWTCGKKRRPFTSAFMNEAIRSGVMHDFASLIQSTRASRNLITVLYFISLCLLSLSLSLSLARTLFDSTARARRPFHSAFMAGSVFDLSKTRNRLSHVMAGQTHHWPHPRACWC